MKRIFRITSCAVIFSVLLFLLMGCKAFELDISGIEKYDGYTSNVTLDRFLLPDAHFLTSYPYLEGDYHYYENLFESEHVLVALTYDTETYKEAKQYCLDTMHLSNGNRYEYNGYVFAENLALPEFRERIQEDETELANGINQKYPKIFNMFSYNDELNVLVFFGVYDEDLDGKYEKDESFKLSQDDFVSILNDYFFDCYDFESSK